MNDRLTDVCPIGDMSVGCKYYALSHQCVDDRLAGVCLISDMSVRCKYCIMSHQCMYG